MERYDSIIVGAGHNGLTCAAYLAKRGQRVLVLEAADEPGGLAAPREFHPGFRAAAAHTLSHFPAGIVADLGLADFGFEPDARPLPTIGLGEDTVVIRGGEAEGAGDADAARWRELSARLARFAGALEPFWLKTMPRIGNNSLGELLTFAHVGLNLRRLGKRDMHEFLRVASLPTRDLMDENFTSPVLKAALSWDGLIGGKMAPRSPNGAVLAMLYRLAGNAGGAHRVPAGGVGRLVSALVGAARDLGAELRCASPVERILVDGDDDGPRATGVEVAGGERIDADRVVSTADPKNTFLKLVGVEHLGIEFSNRIRRLRSDGYVAKLHLALDGLPAFAADTDTLKVTDGRAIVAPHMEALEVAFDAAKYGELPETPVMEVVFPSVHDPSCAPAGRHVLSAHVMYVPRRLAGGWSDAPRQALADACLDLLNAHAPGLREQVVASELLTPADIEHELRVTGGHWHHAEFAIDQMLMMRPTYGAAQYRTPIAGLWLAGAGSHPGGDLTGAAGHNAAQEMLR